jgi:cytochrome P450
MATVSSQEYSLSEIDHHAPYFVDRHYEIYEELREKCPVAHSTAWGGFYFLLDYDAVYDADQDTDLFSSAPERSVPMAPVPVPFVPLDSDPPQHGQYRKMTLPMFSPKAAKRVEPDFRRIATELIDDFIESGEADIVGQLTTPLPAIWILQLLGFDETRWPQWVEWIHSMIHSRSSDPEKAGAAVANIHTHLVTEVERRRTEGYRDDLLSVIMQGQVDGQPLSDDLINSYAFLMLIGGMDTTSGLTGNALVQLLRHPELRERLINDPDILPSATEEFLRHDTPAQTQGRVVKRDCVFKGQQLQEGDHVLLVHAAANRDPKVFPDPDRIDFDRKANRQIAFGVGPHRCLGANHARVMFEVMISEILQRLPDFTLAGEIEYFPDAGDVFAVRRLPIRFTPGLRATPSSS